MRGIRRIRGHDYAWDAFRCPCWSELTKILLILEMPGLKTKRSICPVKFATAHPQMHAPGRSRLPSNPSVLSSRQSWQLSFVPRAQKTRAALHSQKHFLVANPNRLRARLSRNRCVKVERLTPCFSCPATNDSLRRLVPISAAFGLRYRRAGSGVDGTGACDG
jgi:hypothetical protein